jgi:hypothetical protein
MPASKLQLINGQFQDVQGNPLANGYLTMKLSADEEVNDSLICSGVEIYIQLDANGNCVAGQYVWGNDVMSPVNSFYKVTGYTVQGQIAFGPNNQQVIGSGGTFDVGSWVPNHVISWVPSVQSLSVEIAGTALGSQSILNFVNTGNVTFVDNGNGQISASAPAGGGTVTSVFGRSPVVIAMTGDYTVAQVTGAAPLASPALTGVPTAPTATVGTNTTQLATTAFVIANAGGNGPLLTATVNISSAQILASFTTPVTLLTGIAGKVIIPRQILFNYIHGATPYAGTAAADVWWTNLTTFSSVSIANISLAMLTQTTNQLFIALTAASGFFWNGASADIVGQGIVFKAETSNPINGTGSLVVTIEYEVISGIV